jgi:hypothetical protein
MVDFDSPGTWKASAMRLFNGKACMVFRKPPFEKPAMTGWTLIYFLSRQL